MNYIIYALIWILWCTFHSLLISQRFTRIVEQRLGDFFRYYRLGYNFFSTLTLLIPLWYGWHLRGEPLFTLDGIFSPLRFSLLAASLYLFIAGAGKYDLSRFTGIFQATTGKQQASIGIDDKLDTSGIHRITRHPWYIGGIFLIWSYQSHFDLQSVITGIILTLYFIIGAVLEERKLVALFGQQYIRYQQEVSMLLPWKWLKKILHATS